jgi:uncharacterized membrane protein YkvA (DUF1232 family)
MPLDLVPDFIPVLGYIDDVLIAGVAVWWFLRACSPKVVLAEIERLEGKPCTTADRLMPWVLVPLVAGCAVALVLFWY